ncbi:MAG: vitamin B12-dependent ribonucleotide reductase [bacterium]
MKKKLPEDGHELPIPENSLRVLERRYLKKDQEGNPIETPLDMFQRVARSIAEIDRVYDPKADVKAVEDEFYQLMTRFEFMPNSPTLMNAGRELGQLSACFVIPVDDSLDSIFQAVKHTAMIHKSGGGTGFSFNRLRPKNDVVNTTRGVASGPISFMRVFDSSTEEIKQGGTRRGANMGILNVDHPDIEDFIHCKEDIKNLTNFNISVGLTEEFMQAVEKDGEYPLRNPRTRDILKTVPARRTFDEIVEAAWRTGEPGIIFLDRINSDNPTPKQGKIESTNPCGEQPLLPYESCNLGSINLGRMVTEGKIDYDRLGRVIDSSVHFLDNVIDANNYPLAAIEETTRKNRKIGLGIMGFADMLVQIGVPYDSDQALDTAREVMSFIRERGRQASARIAAERGPFPAFEESVYKQRGDEPLRNATITTIAPTGTISIICGASSGIEPYYAVSYIRTCMDNDELAEVNPYFEEVAREQGFYSEELMKEVARSGSVRDVAGIPDEVKNLFVTAMDISPEWHVKMQAAFQEYTDNAVSKTVNFPADATREHIKKVYWLAYKTGCKGVTVYRDKSRDNQVLSFNKEQAQEEETADIERGTLEPRPRHDVVNGITRKMPTGCGSLYVTVNEDEQGLFEVFTNMGKAGGCAASQAEAVSRLISLALRAGIKAETIVRQLKGISCPMMVWWEGGHKILSCADAIAKAIELYPNYTRNGSHKVETSPPAGDHAHRARSEQDPRSFYQPEATLAMCPECGGAIEFKEGCLTCPLCGFTRCG